MIAHFIKINSIFNKLNYYFGLLNEIKFDRNVQDKQCKNSKLKNLNIIVGKFL